MAGRAIGGKHKCAVVGIGRLVKVILVTAYASCRCIQVISIMAGGTIVGNGGMGPIEWVKIIMIGHGRRIPVWIGGMAGSTIH